MKASGVLECVLMFIVALLILVALPVVMYL